MRIRTNLILYSSLGIYLLLYFIYYPKTYAIFDEACYLDLAYALRKGTVFLEQTDLGTIHYPLKIGSHLVSLYPVGNSGLLMLFTFCDARGLFLFGLLFHLLSYIVFIKVLRQTNVDPKYAILYLFYPPQVLFSRTIMSDIPATFFFLLAFYAYQKEKYTTSGISLGLAFLVRYASIAFLPALLIFAIVRKRLRGLKVIAGFFPFMLFVLFYNYIVYGGVLSTGYSFANQLFDIRRCAIYLGTFLLTLSIFYPLIIVSPFFYKKSYRLEILTSCVVLLLFYTFSSFSFSLYAGPSIKTLFLTVRYFFPLIPLLLIPYSSICAKYINKIGFLIVWIGLIIISSGIHQYHNQYLNTQARFRDSLYSHTNINSLIIGNGEASELVSKAWGKRHLILLEPDIDFSAKQDVWLASLIKLDKPSPEFMWIRDSIISEFNADLVEELSGTDKKFELYKIK